MEPVYVLVVLAVVIAAVLFFRRKPALPERGGDEDQDDVRAPLEKAPVGRTDTGRKTAAPDATKQEKLSTPKPATEPKGKEPRAAASRPAVKPAVEDATAGSSRGPDAPGSESRSAETVPTQEDVVAPAATPTAAIPEKKKAAEPSSPTVARRERDVEGLRRGLAKMRSTGGFFGRLKELFVGKKEINPKLVEEIEEILITSDVGAKTTEELLESIRDGLAKKELSDDDRVWAALRRRATELLDLPGGGGLRDGAKPTVVLMVGVNGAGKTTTIGKLATKLTERGSKVLLVAGDTFRAAAVQQLQAWGKRTGCEVFAGKENADPASVLFDAVTHAVAHGHDIVLCDTAGRLHTKSNLMDELKKVHRTAQKVLDGAPHEVLLVVDGTTGQNALQQAAEFGDALPLTGIVLTKLDGTAKGGVVLAIANERRLPVRYVGVGERAQDLRDFEAGEFVEALLGQNDDAHAA